MLDFEERINYYRNIFERDDTLTVRKVESECGQLKCALIFIDGMVKNEIISDEIVLPIQEAQVDISSYKADKVQYIVKKVIRSKNVEVVDDKELALKMLRYGDTMLLVDGVLENIIIETKGWERRSITESSSERGIAGPKESFNESVITNLSLIRRRILDGQLKMEKMIVGKRSQTILFLAYMDDIAPKELVDSVRQKLNDQNLDAVLDTHYLSSFLIDNKWSLFRLIGSSQRPDVIAAKLLEGKVAIFCDGSPEVIYAPYFFYEIFEVQEDYYVHYIFAIINRILRNIAFVITTCVPAVYIALITFHQQMIPREFFVSIASSRYNVPFPSIVEAIVLLVVFEIIRESGTRLPKNIGDAISIVGALLLGDAIVRAEIVSAPIVIIVALSGITSLMLTFNLQSVIVIRFGLIIASTLFGLFGFIFGVMFITAYLLSLDSVGYPYMRNIYRPQSKNDYMFRKPWSYAENNVKNINGRRRKSKGDWYEN